VNVTFKCPECGHPGDCRQAESSAWQCPACDHRLALTFRADGSLSVCAVCGDTELYRKKDFPHWLGMLLLVVACIGFFIANYLYEQWLAWGILLGSALIDGLLYLAVDDVIVCYRCDALHRRFPANPAHQPYELTIGERYRQEKLRHEQVQSERKPSG
jgi:hypothetical protein